MLTKSNNSYLVSGTAIHSAVVHSSLFGSYELIRHEMRRANGNIDLDTVPGLIVVASSGGAAGIVSEIFGHCFAEFEDLGAKEALARFSQYLRSAYLTIPWRNVLWGALPGSLGFLALEFGKEALEIR